MRFKKVKPAAHHFKARTLEAKHRKIARAIRHQGDLQLFLGQIDPKMRDTVLELLRPHLKFEVAAVEERVG